MSARADVSRATRVLWQHAGAVTRKYAVLFGVLHFVDRLALLAVAWAAPRDDRAFLFAATCAFAAFSFLRTFVGSLVHGHAHAALHVSVVRALLERDLFRASAFDEDDPEAAVLEGLEVGVRISATAWPAIVADAAACVVSVVVLARVVEPFVLVAGCVALVVAAVALTISRRITSRVAETAWDAHRPVLDRLVAILVGRLEIVANGADELARARMAEAAERWRLAIARYERAAGVAARIPLVLGAALLTAVVWSRSLRAGSTLSIDLVIVAAALPPFAGLARGLHELTKLSVRASRVVRLLAPLDGALPTPSSSVTAPRKIALANASYRYDANAKDVIVDASCELTSGTITVLRGANGSGKSTLLRLLLAIELPREGALRVDDRPVDDGASLRAHVAYLPQRPFVSDRASVRENLALLVPDIDEANAKLWLERVGLWGALAARGRDPFEVRAGELSSGQKQRLALARFGMLDRTVWLLDEPDASIDAEGLTRLAAILDEERPRRIIVVAAHAENIARVADRVIHVEAGALTDEPRPSGTFP